MDLQTLHKILPYAGQRATRFLPHLNATLARYQINTPKRIAAFIAQVGHESGSLRYTVEIASGKAYEGRADLGNTQPGDGERFKGRGLIQITGRANYAACSQALYGDDRLVRTPKLLEQEEAACLSAGWFWTSRGLNTLADENDFLRITKRINGGTNGLAERQAIYATALEVLA